MHRAETKASAESRASLDSKLDELELMWKPGQAGAYFARAREIVESLPYESSGPAQVGATDLRVMTTLAGFLSAPATVPADLEQQKVRLLATLLGRLRNERVTEYVWQEVYLNVAPPPGVRGTAGMSPDAIEDPAAREQYKAAGRENRAKALNPYHSRA